METQTVTVMNTQTGQAGQYPRGLWENTAIFPRDVFAEVKDGTKSYLPEMFKPTTPEKLAEKHPEKVAEKTSPAEKAGKEKTIPTPEKDVKNG